jgi:ElaB/YqjD/DUF883 family membrane-anchored ribosome-binding protein
MSANFPTGKTDNGADTTVRSSTSSTSSAGNYEAGKTISRQASAENLRQELGNLKHDLDNLLLRASDLSERELSEAYARMMTKFSSMRFAAKGIAAEASRQLNQGVDITSDYVKAKPLQSVALSAGVGLVLGMLMTRR